MRSGRVPARAPVTCAMCLCVALVVGMVSAVNLAIPDLSAGPLHPSAAAVVWVVDGYVVVFACLLVPAGALADRRGRKGTLLCGMAVFVLGSAVCAVAPHVGVLIAGRMISGVGAAAVLPNTLALLVDGLSDGPRRRAIAVWAAMTGLAAVLGNVGGGAAIQYGSWRALFVCVVPVAVGASVLVAVVAPVTGRHPGPVAPLAAVLFTGGFLALLNGIVSGPGEGWLGPWVLGSFGVAGVLLTGWARCELRSARPLLDPRVFARPAVRAGAVGMAVLFLGMFGLFYLNGQYLQYAKGYGPFGAGVRLLPMAAALLAGPRCGLVLERRCGRRGTVGTGMLVLAGGLATVSAADAGTPYALYAVGAGLTALGCGTATPLLSHAMMSALPSEAAGVGSGLQSLTRELGSALGIAVTGTLTAAVFTARLPAPLAGPGAPTTVAAAQAALGDLPDRGGELRTAVIGAFTDGLHLATLALAAGVAVAAGAVFRWMPREGEAEAGTARASAGGGPVTRTG
ncbi:MFS transporter [Streptomyces yunnanensis]|uniref:Predicted arabinose efflux permease, MFS family n=1 Tax=Streptomyces yunnanensis TaxID=156453 RepID=A0A9X8QRQ9_9ACTN|nr:MFS transporter [Streptomyces yunnanensis]SHL59597.1 Predicted arabinose efflux permease, MFS family [Streptomyces yunnanensis]